MKPEKMLHILHPKNHTVPKYKRTFRLFHREYQFVVWVASDPDSGTQGATPQLSRREASEEGKAAHLQNKQQLLSGSPTDNNIGLRVVTVVTLEQSEADPDNSSSGVSNDADDTLRQVNEVVLISEEPSTCSDKTVVTVETGPAFCTALGKTSVSPADSPAQSPVETTIEAEINLPEVKDLHDFPDDIPAADEDVDEAPDQAAKLPEVPSEVPARETEKKPSCETAL